MKRGTASASRRSPHTHSAAVVDAANGGVLDEITVEATAEGYAELVEFANNHAMLRTWAIEGTGGHGAGLSRHLLEMSELVIESDRPKRAARRNGAKSDPLDAIRAAREAMARPRWGAPRTGEERQALSVLLAGSTATATANSTTHCTPWSRPRSSTSQPPATTSPAAPPKARPAERSTLPCPLRRPRHLPPA
uniref:Uncharacterized protein n=1 Tax=uncultured Nocardioidaceae bacterium TaxID=253824 RepID=A0A6J4KP08_9ACTN|nr:MAG: hypothetical protein AVDCRST_MAG46-137 [uncultured Nocardioidaceae bacterium]